MRIVVSIVVALACVACSAVTAQDLGLRLETGQEFLAALLTARHHVRLSAYSLSPRQPVTRYLLADARRGVAVRVVLSGSAFGVAAQQNAAAAAELRAAGVPVSFTGFATHLKAAIVDNTVYLSDVNFAEHGLVVVDAIPGDSSVIAAAIAGTAHGNDHLWTRKADALAAEARVAGVRMSGEIDVASESFGSGTALYQALQRRAAAGDHVRLLVAAREARGGEERAALGALKAAGVQIRLGDRDEKMAIDGSDAWFGSANATSGVPDQVEWGMALRSTALAAALHARFEGEWALGSPY